MYSIDDCKLLQLQKIDNKEGSLHIAECGIDMDFLIKRIYYISNVPPTTVRGGHAHKNLHQIIIPISGSFEILIDDGRNKKEFLLDDRDFGLYVTPMIWRDIYNFSDDAVCLVLASDKYDESDYFRNYDVFYSIVNT